MPTESWNSPGNYSWTVPSGVQEVTVRLWGAQGGDNSDTFDGSTAYADGGHGGYVEGVLPVSPGETLYIYVGGAGGSDSGGYNGGGDTGYDDSGGRVSAGGGGTDIRQNGNSTNDRVVVAGGGGGCYSQQSISGPVTADGGAGGGTQGISGNGDDPGQGGTQSSGGNSSSNGGENGSFFNGGQGSTDSYGAGAGGGYYGGGGAHGSNGAGGGSGYTGGLSSVVSNDSGANSGDGQAEIEYQQQPAAPNNVEQTVDGDDAIDVSWDTDTSSGDPAEYDIEVAIDGGAYSTVTTVTDDGSTSYTYTYAATPANNDHQFRVRATNGAGSSDWVQTAAVLTDPENLAITETSSRQIDLAWDGVRDADGYAILRAESTGSTAGDYSAVATVGAATTTYSNTELEDGERYYYRIRATYDGGTDSQPTSEVDATSPLPGPTIDSLDASVKRELTVNYTLGDNSSDGDVTVEQSTDSGSSWTTVATISDLSQTAYTDTNLLDGEEYTYRLTRSTDHDSAESGTASAITILPAPTDLTVSNVDQDSADLSWTATHNNGQTRVEYRPTGDDWSEWSTLDRTTETETLDGLRNGEEYEVRIVATTEHADTEDT